MSLLLTGAGQISEDRRGLFGALDGDEPARGIGCFAAEYQYLTRLE